MSDGVGVGIDVGGTKILAVALHSSGTVIGKARAPTPVGLGDLATTLVTLTSELLDSLDPGAAVSGLGLALPGLVDRDGVLHAAPNLGASETGLDLRTSLAAPLARLVGTVEETSVAIANDATAAAIAECALGSGRGRDDVVVVSLGTGIGAGIITGGRLVLGARGYAGELGHMVIDPAGPPCPCGKRGCWERFASGSGLAWLAMRQASPGAAITEAADGAPVQGEHVIAAARLGDRVARAVIVEFSQYLAVGLANLTEILDTELVILVGGLTAAADVWLAPAREAFVRHCRPAQARGADYLQIGELGEEAAALGAASLGLGLGALASS